MATYQSPEQWKEWSAWLSCALQSRSRWRLPVILMGILFATGRRTVSTWLRAAGVSPDYREYYYFLQAVGRKARPIAERLFVLVLRHIPLGERVLLALDDSPTKRYGPHVEGAGIHHNPTPGPADQKFLYGHIWVTVSVVVRHALWGPIGLPLLAMLYVRQKDFAPVAAFYGWKFATKLQLAVKAVMVFAEMLQKAGKRVWVVADGAYAKRPVLKPLLQAGLVLVSRLRRDAALRSVPPPLKPGEKRGRGRPPTYGKKRLSLVKRAGQNRGWQTVTCVLYDKTVTKTVKTFLATYAPAGGLIRVVLVREDSGCEFFFCTLPEATVAEILEAFADRAAIEQDFHDVKEVWGTGQQQVRRLWTNIAVFQLNLWMHTLTELWAWNRSSRELIDRRDSPWDDPARRPSHADRRKALQRACLTLEFLRLPLADALREKISSLLRRLTRLAA
jgi:hypothetical protein